MAQAATTGTGIRFSDSDDAYGEFIDAFKADPANIRAAADYTDGTQDESHYTDLSLALYDLHGTDPDKIASTDVLTRLYQLAKARAATINAELETRAEAAWEGECDRLRRESDDHRTELAAAMVGA